MAVIERVLCVVDRCLKSQFPDTYYKRCLYAAFGTHVLLEEMGYDPEIVGGDFGAFVSSKDQRTGAFQGYSSESDDQPHYWVELDGAILDLGTHYLPVASSFPASDMPVVFWNLKNAFPKGLKYVGAARYSSSETSQLAPHIAEQMIPFLASCRARIAKPLVKPKIGKWLATSPAAIEQAAKKGDLWARGIIRYELTPAGEL